MEAVVTIPQHSPKNLTLKMNGVNLKSNNLKSNNLSQHSTRVHNQEIDSSIEAPNESYYDTNETKKFHNGYGEWGHVISHSERSILPDLKIFPFSDEIKHAADGIYNKMTPRVRRGRIRNQMLFYCVYCAHLELGIKVDPYQLGLIFNLKSGDIQKCDSLFSPLQTNYRPPNTTTSPLHYLPEYCRALDLSDDTIEEIKLLAQTILRKDPDLFQESPKTVAAGFLRYFTFTNGITTDDPEKLSKVTGRSYVTIEQMHRRITIIHNS